jgi:hypothetical protein
VIERGTDSAPNVSDEELIAAYRSTDVSSCRASPMRMLARRGTPANDHDLRHPEGADLRRAGVAQRELRILAQHFPPGREQVRRGTHAAALRRRLEVVCRRAIEIGARLLTQKTLIGLVATFATLVVAVVLALYLSGPSWKASGKLCPILSGAVIMSNQCVLDAPNRRFVVPERTNAWERFKGAITGNP